MSNFYNKIEDIVNLIEGLQSPDDDEIERLSKQVMELRVKLTEAISKPCQHQKYNFVRTESSLKCVCCCCEKEIAEYADYESAEELLQTIHQGNFKTNP